MKKKGLTNLKKIREIYGISQNDLAKEIGVERYQIADWEQGRSEPNLTQLNLMSNYFSKSADYLSDYRNYDKITDDHEGKDYLQYAESIENLLMKKG